MDYQSYIRTHKIIDPSEFADKQRPKLFLAAMVLGDTELVRKCIELGVDYSDPWNLDNASYYGHYEIVKMLLERGADPLQHGGASILTSKYRGHEKTYQLLNLYLRKHKIDKILKR